MVFCCSYSTKWPDGSCSDDTGCPLAVKTGGTGVGEAVNCGVVVGVGACVPVGEADTPVLVGVSKLACDACGIISEGSRISMPVMRISNMPISVSRETIPAFDRRACRAGNG